MLRASFGIFMSCQLYRSSQNKSHIHSYSIPGQNKVTKTEVSWLTINNINATKPNPVIISHISIFTVTLHLFATENYIFQQISWTYLVHKTTDQITSMSNSLLRCTLIFFSSYSYSAGTQHTTCLNCLWLQGGCSVLLLCGPTLEMAIAKTNIAEKCGGIEKMKVNGLGR